MSSEPEVPTDRHGQNGASSSVQRFYAGASVLVTGATGFVGKVLLEKLLWACPDITAIYLLVRNKKGQTVQERMNTLLSSQCFDRLRKTRGAGFAARLIPVQGDIAEVRLGLGDLDLELLTRHVSVVFHVAATVRFNEPLHVAVTLNVRGTRELLALCTTFTQLKAMVYVSTAYSHCPLSYIEERFYDAPMDCDEAIKMAAQGEFTPSVTDSLLGPWPNTYSFTKALAEDVVRKHGHGLPVCVFRPAVVVSSSREPVEGWVDNMAGPGVALAGILTGYIRVMYGNTEADAGLVPCDMVVDAMIAAAWEVAQGGESRVYNFTPSPCNKITWLNYFLKYHKVLRDMPSSKAIWTVNCVVLTKPAMMFVLRFLMQTLPAWIADAALVLTGRKPFARRLYNKITISLDSSSYFALRQWNFQEKNVPALWDKLDRSDKQVFNFDMRALDWDEYVKRTSPGIRQFILHEDPSTLPEGRVRVQRILRVQKVLKTGMYLMAMYAVFFSMSQYNIFGV